MGELERLHAHYGDRVDFFIVYIKEAHPEDGWILEENREEGIALDDPRTAAERADAAATCVLRLQTTIPVLLDDEENTAAAAYGGWPDRLYLVGSDGRVAYQGEEGPFGFRPDELERAIEGALTHAT